MFRYSTRFRRRIEAIGFHQGIFNAARDRLAMLSSRVKWDPVSVAVDFFIVNRQSLGVRMDTFAPPSRRIRHRTNEPVSVWLKCDH